MFWARDADAESHEWIGNARSLLTVMMRVTDVGTDEDLIAGRIFSVASSDATAVTATAMMTLIGLVDDGAIAIVIVISIAMIGGGVEGGKPFLTPSRRIRIMTYPDLADVAELADAQVSEACDGDIVEVQVLSSAPNGISKGES